MKTYELTYIISARLGAEEMATLVKNIEGFIQEKEGVIITSQKTVAQSLAYPINKQSSGYYATLVFQAAEDIISAVKAMLEKETDVLRHLILIKKPLREMKERRTRKPIGTADAKPAAVATQTPAEKVSEVDLDKKLGEILGE